MGWGVRWCGSGCGRAAGGAVAVEVGLPPLPSRVLTNPPRDPARRGLIGASEGLVDMHVPVAGLRDAAGALRPLWLAAERALRAVVAAPVAHWHCWRPLALACSQLLRLVRKLAGRLGCHATWYVPQTLARVPCTSVGGPAETP